MTSGSVVVKRYVQALHELAVESDKCEQVTAQLKELVALFRESNELRQVMESPTIPSSRKIAIFEELESGMGLEDLTSNYVKLLMKKGRMNLLEAMVEQFENLERERRGVLVVELTTAASLGKDIKAELAGKLESGTGKKIEIITSEDEKLIGGIVARIGGTIYDGSIEHQLELMRQKLGEE